MAPTRITWRDEAGRFRYALSSDARHMWGWSDNLDGDPWTDLYWFAEHVWLLVKCKTVPSGRNEWGETEYDVAQDVTQIAEEQAIALLFERGYYPGAPDWPAELTPVA